MKKEKDKTVSQIVQASSFFLIGLMGSGKSTIGRLLAAHLDCPFIDSDHYIEERTGVDISYIFDIEGEEGFRIREEKAIAELTVKQNIVLSTGGGAILSKKNREYLKKRGTVFYLQISPESIVERLKEDESRPLLQQENRLEILEQLLKERERYYTEIADYIIMVDDCAPSEIVEIIFDKIRVPR